MYCPQCGQQQVSDVTRFCSRCGFLLDGVTAVLAAGGQVPMRYVQPGNTKLSPRSKGVRQGALMMLSTLLLVPLMAIITVNFDIAPEFFVPATAIIFFVGGLLRMLYALMMEDAYPQPDANQAAGYGLAAPQQVEASARNVALPPAPANPVGGWRSRPNTAEIYQPPSITENTTRLLDKDDPNRK
ncbi:MAG TPA: zinc ribbon domain-containing protein [Pyrinomonadaceae bacterium]|nr:zinc ribbon domain-containing protein [Pyrinomonadaceae bacterium]